MEMKETDFTASLSQPEEFAIEASIQESLVEELMNWRGGNEQQISAFLRGKSKISIGEPLNFSLLELLAARGEAIAPEIQLQLKDYDFRVMQFSCSFTPAEGSRFFDALFSLELFDPENNQAEKPLAYDLYPVSLRSETKVSRKFNLSPQLNLQFGPLKLAPGGLTQEKVEEGLAYRSQIEAFGLRTSQAGWKFTRTNQQEINGSYQLFVVIRQLKGRPVAVKYGMETRVEPVTHLLPIGEIPLMTTFRRQGKLVEPIKLLG